MEFAAGVSGESAACIYDVLSSLVKLTTHGLQQSIMY